MAEVSVDALWIPGGKLEFADRLVGGDIDHAQDRGVAILYENHVTRADGLGSVNFSTGGSVVVPQDFLIRVD